MVLKCEGKKDNSFKIRRFFFFIYNVNKNENMYNTITYTMNCSYVKDPSMYLFVVSKDVVHVTYEFNTYFLWFSKKLNTLTLSYSVMSSMNICFPTPRTYVDLRRILCNLRYLWNTILSKKGRNQIFNELITLWNKANIPTKNVSSVILTYFAND